MKFVSVLVLLLVVPHSRKSWSDYHAKKKSATFGDRRF